jgi:DNA-binding NarL/FixJ family response regulator
LSVPRLDETPAAKDLTAYEAVRLLVERGAAVVPGFRLDDRNAPAVAGVCERLEGIPLALELAAVRLRSLSPEQVLERLDDRFHLLSGGGPAASPRHKTLEATIAWSYDLLSEAEQTLWRMASIFSGSFDLEAAERVCVTDALPKGLILDLIDGLVVKSILVGDSGGPLTRYRMLDTLREYGQRRHPDPSERGAARRRHRDWYSSLAARQDWLGPHQVQWVDALRAEHLNLRAALEFCLGEPGEAEAGLRLACDLWLYWETDGHLTEGRRVLDAVLAHPGHPPILRARALWVAGYLALVQGEAARSAELLKQALDIGRRLADQETIAYASQFLGRALWFMGDAVHGLSLTLEAQELHRSRGDAWGLVLTLVQLGVMRAVTGDPRGAIAPFVECLALCEEHGERWNRSYAQWGLGLSRWLLGETAGAEALVVEALGTKRHVGDRAGAPLCLDTLALIAADDGRMARAATLLGAAEATWRSIPATPPEPFGLRRDACSAKVRKTLGGASFQAAFQRGKRLDPVQAVAFALGEVPPAPQATRPVNGPADLSPREDEVASLVAGGLSNREIAASLVISARTAETHVQHIMDKLGFTSRAQIGAWATDHSRKAGPSS